MQALLRIFAAMTRVERIVLAVFSVLLIVSFGMLLRSFYISNTHEVPVRGGTYIEGSVGDVLPLNPWFTVTNDVNRDIVSLIFSGLLKYNPKTGNIEEDLATLQVSEDNRLYTLTLKNNLFWHDSTEEKPHPVTADDVLFTFQTVQQPDFPNPLLHQNFRGVTIDKLDDHTVRFKLDKPYAFFKSNLTLGLLPKEYFEGIPPGKMDEAIDFGLKPVGAGPYGFVSLIQTDVSTEVTLKRFPREGLSEHKIDRVVFRVFPDYSSLLNDIINLNGVRLVPRNDQGKPILPRKFKPVAYSLPQYTALFFNLDRELLADRALRLGLQLATDKQAIIDVLNVTRIVDTPLLEIDLTDWRYRFDATAAQGALFNSNWHMPEKLRLQRLLEHREANIVGPLKNMDAVVYLQTGATLTLTGSISELGDARFINGIRVQTGSNALTNGATSSGTWIVRIPTSGSGSLKPGSNIVKLTKPDGDIVDSAFVERFTDSTKFPSARTEQRLVEQFLRSKNMKASDPKFLSIEQLYLDDATGTLRRRAAQDQPHTRVNTRGTPLKLTILTSDTPESYKKVAETIQAQWKRVGVEVAIEVPATRKEFEDRLLKRNYDIVLFGQSLLDNLDSYPYWHSSQIQARGDETKLKRDAFNLSQYTSFEADSLLSRIRETADADSRAKALNALNDVIKRDVPAVFLYSPLYVAAYDEATQGVEHGKLSLHSDRLANMDTWFISTTREFKAGSSWFSFPGWLIQSFF